MVFFTYFATLLLALLPLVAQAQYVQLYIYKDYTAADRALYLYKSPSPLGYTPAQVTRSFMYNIVYAAAVEMQTKAATEIPAGMQPAAMTAYTDGTGYIWLHSSIKGGAAGATALRSAQVITTSVHNSLKWCDDRGGHGNDGNCGEVGAVNQWMLDTGAERATAATSLIITVSVPRDGKAPFIMNPCGNPESRGCRDFLRGVGLGNAACQITSLRRRTDERQVAVRRAVLRGLRRRGPGDPVPVKPAVVKAPAGGAVVKAPAGGAPQKALGTTSKAVGLRSEGSKSWIATFKAMKEAKRVKKKGTVPPVKKLAAKDELSVWGLACAGKPLAAAKKLVGANKATPVVNKAKPAPAPAVKKAGSP